MHNAAFGVLGLNAEYHLLDVPPADFSTTLADLRLQGYGGLNITLPHKLAAYRWLLRHGTLTDHARMLQSVNTIRFPPSVSLPPEGDNTDAPGFLDALRASFHTTVRHRRVMVLGIGGAGRALALTCLFHGAAALAIAARKPAARRLWMNELRRAAPGLPMEGMTFARAARCAGDYDLIIQATPVGMNPGDPSLLPVSAFHKGQMVVDLVYTQAVTPFLRAARTGGARATNGLGMLLYQGARAFHFWTGHKAPLSTMQAVLQNAYPLPHPPAAS